MFLVVRAEGCVELLETLDGVVLISTLGQTLQVLTGLIWMSRWDGSSGLIEEQGYENVGHRHY